MAAQGIAHRLQISQVKTLPRFLPRYRRTKSGTVRKGAVNCTLARFQQHQTFWVTLRQTLRDHLSSAGHGAAIRMAQSTGIDPSQIHRWTCADCEHNQEPTFSQGMAILMYLSCNKFKASAIHATRTIRPSDDDQLTDDIATQTIRDIYANEN